MRQSTECSQNMLTYCAGIAYLDLELEPYLSSKRSSSGYVLIYLCILPAISFAGYCIAGGGMFGHVLTGGKYLCDALVYLPCSYALCVRIRPCTTGPGGPWCHQAPVGRF